MSADLKALADKVRADRDFYTDEVWALLDAIDTHANELAAAQAENLRLREALADVVMTLQNAPSGTVVSNRRFVDVGIKANNALDPKPSTEALREFGLRVAEEAGPVGRTAAEVVDAVLEGR